MAYREPEIRPLTEKIYVGVCLVVLILAAYAWLANRPFDESRELTRAEKEQTRLHYQLEYEHALAQHRLNQVAACIKWELAHQREMKQGIRPDVCHYDQ